MQHSGPLSDKEKFLLEQFKEVIKDVIKPEYDDEYLVRWLRAREWDLKKAEKMLRDSLAWRSRSNIDKILEWQPPEVLKYWPGNFFGHDKEGYPIWYELLGYADIRGLIGSATKKDLVRFKLHLTEKLFQQIFPENSKKFGKRIDKVVYIVDLEGVGMKHLWKPAIDVYTELIRIVEANYPETLGRAYVINAPAILPILYNVIKPLLAEYTRSKIHFLGKNWKEDLLRHIDADQLPVHWGGTCTDPDGDPFCKSQIGLGGTVPKSYYLKNMESDLSQFTTLTVNRGSSAQVEVKVDEPGSIFSWSFLTQNNDIGFGIYRSKEGAGSRCKIEEMEEIVEYARIDCQTVPETGTVVCNVPGTYIVWFDNSYSWINAKKVYHLFQVLLPGENLTESTVL